MRWTCVAALLQVWGRCEALTAGLSSDLAEQLRLVLEPQLASKMAGEYRTGKRISMKRVIAYIASHFRKDKIWLRRTRPDKRKYQASPQTVFICQLGGRSVQLITHRSVVMLMSSSS